MNALRTFLITGIGLCLLALAASVPIGCEYVGHVGPEWIRSSAAACNDERAALLRQEGPPPRILLTGTDAKAYHAVLVALHPDADLHVAQGEEALPQNMEGAYAAVLSEKNSAPLRCDTALRLDYEHCGCWIWPELNAAFFLNHSFSLFSKL